MLHIRTTTQLLLFTTVAVHPSFITVDRHRCVHGATRLYTALMSQPELMPRQAAGREKWRRWRSSSSQLADRSVTKRSTRLETWSLVGVSEHYRYKRQRDVISTETSLVQDGGGFRFIMGVKLGR